MKKIVLVGVLAGLGLLVGCDNNKKAATPPSSSTELTTPTPQPYIPPSTPVTVTPMDSGTSSAVVTPPVTDAPAAPARAARKAPTYSAPESSVAAGSTYVVKSGDSLSKIALKAYGSASQKNINRIKSANNLKSDVVRVGQKLKIPGGSTSSKKKPVSGNKG